MITLRIFTEAELGYFDDYARPGDGSYSFFGFRGSQAVRARFAIDNLVGADDGTLAVDLDGGVIGDVQWHTVRYGPPPVTPSFNIGVKLDADQRGHGYGTAAQDLLADHLFATYPVNRLEAGTDTSNLAEQRALVKAGFTREGVLRGAQFRAGHYRDLALYSRLRDDNPAKAR